MSDRWLVLAAALPTRPSGLRVRVWRALKATGAATLREGVYLLPGHAGSAPALRELQRSIAASGADSHLLVVPAHSPAQEREFRKLFDRSAAWAELLQALKLARQGLARAPAGELRRTLRGLQARHAALQAQDFFPGAPGRRAAAALAALEADVLQRLSPGEPAAVQAAIPRRAIEDHQGRTWATRKRPWVDRLACAWLVQRFIDRQPRFVWLADVRRCPKSALGYDFDGATFTHVGQKVSFEVMAESFQLLHDPALQRLAALVHCIDIGGPPVDEAPGFELLIRGLQARHADDGALLTAALPAFDACHAAYQLTDEPR